MGCKGRTVIIVARCILPAIIVQVRQVVHLKAVLTGRRVHSNHVDPASGALGVALLKHETNVHWATYDRKLDADLTQY